jgi:NADH-quinone oxidoreductase subunit M
MQLLGIIVSLLAGGVLALLMGGKSATLSRWISLMSLLVASVFYAGLWFASTNGDGLWALHMDWPWIARFGIHLLLATDGLSLVLIGLTLVLGYVALLSAWHEIKHRCGLFYLNFLFTLAGVVGVFSALDLFLFFVFWEVMLVPMFLMIAIWGHEGRRYAATKFFIYTQASSLLMLVAMVGLVLLNQQQTGVLSFSWFALTQTDTSGDIGMWLMLGFYLAFLVKLPGLPLHNWLPDAHTQAPTPGSILLAGILLKTGAYGLLRFVWPLFPDAASAFAPIAMGLGVFSVLYAAKLAFAQNDLKRLIAYTSISHMGFVSLGVFAWNHVSLQGTVMQMVGHGLSSAGLFAIAGLLQQRLHTRALDQMGGLWAQVPKLAALSMLFSVAALGLPGLANFVGEFMILLAVFQLYPWAATLAALGMVLAPLYALIIMQKGFFGSRQEGSAHSGALLDLNHRELLMLAILVVGLVVLGFWPNLIFTVTAASVDNLVQLGNGG